MKYLPIGILALLFCFTSCSNVPKEVQQILELAGENKAELQKVIDHYQAPKDSLKLKAAYFLITEEIPYGSYVDSANDKELKRFFISLNDSLKSFYGKESKNNFEERSKIIQGVLEEHELKYGKFFIRKWHTKKDIENLTAAFLIENIEYAFKAWELPWSKNYDFDVFCRYILPYRSGKQYPNAWRKYFFEELEFFRDSIGDEQDIFLVNKLLQQHLKQKKLANFVELYNVSQILTGPNMYKYKIYGNCVSISNLAQESMRAIGIPAAQVLVNKFGYNANDHVLNAVVNTNENWQYFSPLTSITDARVFGKKITKIYRNGLVHKNNLTEDKLKAIGKLNLFRWDDITKEVTESYNIPIKLTGKEVITNKIAYLCIFGKMSRNWRIVQMGGISC